MEYSGAHGLRTGTRARVRPQLGASGHVGGARRSGSSANVYYVALAPVYTSHSGVKQLQFLSLRRQTTQHTKNLQSQ